ncbi:tripartite tricarboxylate transporter TctB family protein [Citricoccus nitrophenolicus]|uniref:tripartite tricarboxylate transporter TctB family protein n=1 Tax=Citricoccus nitrophenolicus TaxID=863575 RepID=UPI0039B508A8
MTENDQQARGEDQSRPPHGRVGARAAAAVIVAGSAVILYEAFGIALDGGFGPQQSGFFPIIVGVGLVVFGLGFLATTTFWPDAVLLEHAAEEHRGINWVTVWLAIAGLVAYAFLIPSLGYIVATVLFIIAMTWVAGSRRWILNVAVAILFPIAVYFLFTELLGVRLPAGLLETVL